METHRSCPIHTDEPDKQHCTFWPPYVSAITSSTSPFSTKNAHENPHTIYSLAQLKNLCSPIETLPDEILLRVFAYCATWFNRNSEQSWFNFSWVCQRWRLLALTAPSLWSKFDFQDGIEMTRIMLARTLDTPIFLRITRRIRYPRASVLYLASHVQSRLKELYITSGSDISGTPKRPPLNEITELPIAEKIWIDFGYETSSRTGETLTIDTAPHLSLLHLTYCSFSIVGHRLHALGLLSICRPPENSLLSISKILRLLSATSNLQVLRLVYAMVDEVGTITESPVKLSCLKKCMLEGRPSQCASLLQHISTSHLSQLIVLCPQSSFSSQPSESHLQDVKRICHAALQKLPVNTPMMISLRVPQYLNWSPLDIHADFRDSTGTLACKLKFPWDIFRLEFIAPLLHSSWDSLDLDMPLQIDNFCSMFSLPQRVCVLRVTLRTGLVRVFEALDAHFSNREQNHSADSALPFPALEVFGVHRNLKWSSEVKAILDKWRRHGLPFQCRVFCKTELVRQAILSHVEDRISEMVAMIVDGRGKMPIIHSDDFGLLNIFSVDGERNGVIRKVANSD